MPAVLCLPVVPVAARVAAAGHSLMPTLPGATVPTMLLAAPSTLAPLQEFVEWRLTKESDPNAELPKLHTLIPGHDYAWSGQIPLPGDEGSTMVRLPRCRQRKGEGRKEGH